MEKDKIKNAESMWTNEEVEAAIKLAIQPYKKIIKIVSLVFWIFFVQLIIVALWVFYGIHNRFLF